MSASAVLRLAALAAVATACAPRPAAPPRPDENAIRSALNAELMKFNQAIAGKNTAAVAGMFTEDATWILPDASTFTGRANIEAGAKKFLEGIDSMTIGSYSIDKLIVVSDSEAVTFTRNTYTMKEKGKRPVSRVNPFADAWKKGADGVWRVTYEVNADGPAVAAPPAH